MANPIVVTSPKSEITTGRILCSEDGAQAAGAVQSLKVMRGDYFYPTLHWRMLLGRGRAGDARKSFWGFGTVPMPTRSVVLYKVGA